MSKKFLSIGIAAATILLIPNVVRANQVVIQHGSSSATAVGNNNFAASGVHQSAVQNQHGNPNGSGQMVIQGGHSNAAAIGQNNAVINHIDQASVQNQHGNYGTPQNQLAVQQATGNSAAIGENNLIINGTGQYNLQNQWSY
ncbi:hypothetical protein [Pleurocapsa sp. PCC 7319]|uniref:hypothetical protein n=1 Tax=Pleurocapsa sp. PCC 7319 TaxID=118161 RepID=UPI00034A6249|nr:hypothetical protein [Pleurocapsa sp. PCC 7319]